MKKIGSILGTYFRTTDKWLLLFWVGASVLSVLFLSGLKHAGMISASSSVVRTQLMAVGIGLVAALIISTIDYHLLLGLWKLYLPVCLILIALTFFGPFHSTRGDNQAWLYFSFGRASLSVQPSELLKISFITTFSMHIAKAREELNRLLNVVLLCLHVGAYVLLIQLQGDSGSALIFLGIAMTMLFCAGINWRYIGAAVVALAGAVPVLWNFIMSEDQKMRILTLLNPELSEGYAWQQMQGISALGYGGMRGAGLFNDAHKYVYVPEAINDFIFSYVGEATGFIGCIGVIALLAVISFKVLYNSSVAADDEGKFICIGVFAMIISQTIINLGMCLSLLPVIGVTLPLMSQGGTSVLSMYLGLGLVLSVYCHSKTSLFYE